ncbi:MULTISPECIES: M20 aminoacylase family protein [Bacillus]|uniref:M20 aminoacylase family protein n=1 Tax=Bacillus TaxID=1386 RepID=UPI0013642117|nr:MULTISPECIES: M20 aminoacylase family protein [Bacillus]MBT9287272.1 amidohydrolase [Bacillus velezensis]MCX2822669.1 M20 family metallopeptidase [Bacillus sp. H1F1]QHJ02279.1 amidohydrolase [Bacillus sp. AM1(2019)]QOE04684.1 amidohydrolase [Bacillus amyloliquefaciens]QZY33341.1 amidohydrolase [Bacillus amyloliquefaciens]
MNDITMKDQLIKWRHDLHMIPETAFEEHKTSVYIAEELKKMGVSVCSGLGGTGIVATLKAGEGSKVIGIRAELDALHFTEAADHSYVSKNKGKMHACGHDGHMAILLGTAKILSERQHFNGTVCFIFQPAEEPGKGARAMIEDGLFEQFPLDEIYGLHNMPGLPAGTFATRPGGIMAGEDNFVIRIKGKGAHAARPHMSIDPLVIASQIILALQTIVSRNLDPSVPAVISCTEIVTDGVRNAIPTYVEIKGDTRSYSPDTRRFLEEKMRTISSGICEMHGAECQFEYTHEFAPTTNWEEYVGFTVEAAAKTAGKENVTSNINQMMISEDFSAFLEKVPGVFVFLGNGDEHDQKGHIPLHSPSYDFNDDILLTGAAYFAELVKIRLS